MLLVILTRVYVAIGALWILNSPKDRIHFFLLLAYGLSVNTIRSVDVQIGRWGGGGFLRASIIRRQILFHQNIVFIDLILDSPYVEMAYLFNFLRNLFFDNMITKIL